MDRYLLDTDVIIEWLKKNEVVVEKIKGFIKRGAVIAWTPVSVAEIYTGIRDGEEGIVSELFLVLEVLLLTEEVGKKAGEYLKRYSRSHALEIADALIAGSASHYKMTLWTINKKHYPMEDIRFFHL